MIKLKRMCGITGIILNKAINQDLLTKMTDEIKHRGPDSFGISFHNLGEKYLGLGHRRLSILDLDIRSNQPFYSNSKNTTIVFNGEIYNFNDIKQQLNDYNFLTTSDTEVIVAAYEKWGIDCVKKFIGIFSFALFDNIKKKLFLVRDRHGVKPLYYYFDTNTFLFGSELRPLISSPFFSKIIDINSLNMMLSLKYIPAPFSIFKNTYKVSPGEIIEISETFNLVKYYYWDTIDEYLGNKKIFSDNDIDSEIRESIKRNLISDRGVSTFLSGGIDSTIVNFYSKQFSENIKSYTIGFESKIYDESDESKKTANLLNIKNINHKLKYEEMVNVAFNMATIYDEPFSDSSQLPTYIVNKLVRDGGDVVVLAGDGGDEHFFGYNSFHKSKLRHSLFQLINPFSKIIAFAKFNKKLDYYINTFKSLENFYFSIYSSKNNYYANHVLKSKLDENYLKISFGFLSKIKKEDPLKIEALFAQKVYMIDDILVKVDRASMANGVEARVPLLDHTLTSMANTFPSSRNIRGNEKKIILKSILAKKFPEFDLKRKKRGFSIPLVELLKEEKIKKFILSWSEDKLIKQKLFEPKVIMNLINDFYGNRSKKSLASFLWSYFIFQSWYTNYF